MNIRLRFLFIAFTLFIICLTNAKSDLPTGSNPDKIQGSDALLDSVQIFYKLDGKWEQKGIEKYYYDTLKRVVKINIDNWYSSAELKSDNYIKTYYQNTLYTDSIIHETISNNESYFYFTKYRYDSLLRLNEQIFQYGNSNEIYITSYYYDSTNNCYESIIKKLSDSSNFFENLSKTDYFYNERNKVTEVIGFGWSDNSWMKSDLVNYTYDENDNLIEDEYSYYDWMFTLWFPSSKYNYEYENNRKTKMTLYHYIYFQSGSWNKIQLTNYIYDVDNDLVSEILSNWDTTSGEWIDIHKKLYFYRKPNTISESKPISNNIQLFPNPAGSEINIALPGNISNITKVEVIDITGRQMLYKEKTNDAQSNIQIDIGSLPAGYYLVKVLAGNGVYAGYFVKE